ncbi:MAG TPA: hypothetical protein P5117_03905 [Spirochaetia bacterium]|nr:hypothetical protein [Spirochaetales bacterium]HRY79215.1 hypothetical protein [Spirochaetia bacterium]HRZ88610.1 hypothetical protein [Spirochaetia bacterium]
MPKLEIDFSIEAIQEEAGAKRRGYLLRLTESEHERLKAYAATVGIPLSVILRSVAGKLLEAAPGVKS